MNIGEASERSGCHIETIRYYERIGVLPRAKRTGSGYRDYDTKAVERLQFIGRCRDLGFSLDEVRSLLSLSDDKRRSCAAVDRIARVHLAEVLAKRRQLARLSRELTKMIAACAGGSRETCTILGALADGPPVRRKPSTSRRKAAS